MNFTEERIKQLAEKEYPIPKHQVYDDLIKLLRGNFIKGFQSNPNTWTDEEVINLLHEATPFNNCGIEQIMKEFKLNK